MNIGVTFCSLRKYFLDLNRRKKLRERAEPVSPHKILAIFQTHAHSCAFRFFSSPITRCTLTCSVSFKTLKRPHVDFDSGARENIFRWTFGKLSVTHAKWLRQIFESTNINFDQIRIRDPISAREKKFRFQVARAGGMKKIM